MLEQLEAYLLHFRKFIQKNDRVSIDRVNQYVCELAEDKTSFLSDWNVVYAEFQEFLEAKALTGRVINDVLAIPDLFGDLSHLDANKQALHQRLSSTGQLDA